MIFKLAWLIVIVCYVAFTMKPKQTFQDRFKELNKKDGFILTGIVGISYLILAGLGRLAK